MPCPPTDNVIQLGVDIQPGETLGCSQVQTTWSLATFTSGGAGGQEIETYFHENKYHSSFRCLQHLLEWRLQEWNVGWGLQCHHVAHSLQSAGGGGQAEVSGQALRGS